MNDYDKLLEQLYYKKQPECKSCQEQYKKDKFCNYHKPISGYGSLTGPIMLIGYNELTSIEQDIAKFFYFLDRGNKNKLNNECNENLNDFIEAHLKNNNWFDIYKEWITLAGGNLLCDYGLKKCDDSISLDKNSTSKISDCSLSLTEGGKIQWRQDYVKLLPQLEIATKPTREITDFVYFTNLVKCASSSSSDIPLRAYKYCRYFLKFEIELIKPKLIIYYAFSKRDSQIKELFQAKEVKKDPGHWYFLRSNETNILILPHTSYSSFIKKIENVNKRATVIELLKQEVLL